GSQCAGYFDGDARKVPHRPRTAQRRFDIGKSEVGPYAREIWDRCCTLTRLLRESRGGEKGCGGARGDDDFSHDGFFVVGPGMCLPRAPVEPSHYIPEDGLSDRLGLGHDLLRWMG